MSWTVFILGVFALCILSIEIEVTFKFIDMSIGCDWTLGVNTFFYLVLSIYVYMLSKLIRYY